MAFTSAVNTVHFLLKFIKCKTPIQKSPPIHTHSSNSYSSQSLGQNLSLFPAISTAQRSPKSALVAASLSPCPSSTLHHLHTKQAGANKPIRYISLPRARAQSFSWWNSHSRVLYTHTQYTYTRARRKKSTRAEREPSSASPARELLLEIYSNIFN